ncbi:MAG TPA: MFS transporter [Acetobacteraceae bacterium]
MRSNDPPHGGERMTTLQRRASVLVAMGEFIDGYDLLVMGTAIIYLRPQFHLSPEAVGLLGGAAFFGSIFGLLVFGDLTDRLGRRSIFVANLLFFVVFSIASAFITNTTELFITRFLVGVGVGMDIPTSTAYLAEISPSHRRGAVIGGLTQFTWVLGALTSTLVALPLGWFLGADAWRWMFGLAALPAFLVLLGRRMLPESPRWLLNHGRPEEAQAALAAFGMQAPVRVGVRRGTWGELFVAPYATRSFWCCVLFFLNCLSGTVATIGTPFVLRYVGGLSVNATVIFSAFVWCASIAGTLSCIQLIDRIGRRRLAYISSIAGGVLALCIAFFATTNPVLLVISFMLFSYSGWLGLAGLCWVWSSELFPTHLRGRSQGLCNSLCRLAICITIFLVPVAQAGFGFAKLIVFFAACKFLIALVVWRQPMFATENLHIDEVSGETAPT